MGLFLIPAGLVWLGHRVRERSERARAVFWGGVIGHTLAMAVTLTASMAPPIWWAGGSALRDAAVHWSLLFGALLGAGIALLLHRRGA